MNESFTAAAVQMVVGDDKEANVAKATRLIERAAGLGAKLILLPEMFNCYAPPEVMLANAESIPGATSTAMAALSKRLNVLLAAGSIAEKTDDPRKMHNTALLFGPDGATLAKYRKIHLFDVDLPGQISNRESASVAPGSEPVVAPTPLENLGLAICYDLRFPELFRVLSERGMEVLLLPSAFSAPTGAAHWETLVRARAIENQVYVIAANQVGQASGHFACYGHSMIVDPWGEVLAAIPDGEGVITAVLDPARLAQVRAQLPALKHRRIIATPARTTKEHDSLR